MTPAIKVILADDHALVRDMLGAWLSQLPDMCVAAMCGDADEALAAALRIKPDVLLLDIDMPGLHTFEVARVARSRLPDTHVVFLSAFCSDHFIEQALSVGASGYLTKGESPEFVAQAIRQVRARRACFSAEIEARLVIGPAGAHLAGPKVTRSHTLSGRELEILRYLARAMSRKDIAQTLRLSARTVDRHTSNIMAKLNIHNRAELCRFAIREGLAEP